jgi:succinoglycan biosynthesis transport protein ExoP
MHRAVAAPLSAGYPTDDTDGGLLESLSILLRHKTAILLFALAGLVLGINSAMLMKPVYRTHTSVEVVSFNEDFMNAKQTSPTTTADYTYEVSEEQTQAKLLESDDLLDRVRDKLVPSAARLDAMPHPATAGWRSWFHLSQPIPMTAREQLFEKMVKSLKVSLSPKTRLVKVTVDSTDPQFAVDFANTLVQEFMQQNVEARLAAGSKTSEWLKHEIEGARAKLENSEDVLHTYIRTSGLIFTDDNTNVATEKLQQVQQALSAATADRIAKQSRFELAKHSPPDSLADVLNDPGLRETTSKINDVRRQIADLDAVYTPDFPKIKQAQAQLASLQTALAHDRADIVSRIETDYQEAARRENLFAAAYDGQARAVTGQGEKEIQYNILKREVDSSRQLYDTMLQQMQQASIASALHVSNIRVVDRAKLSPNPISPSFPLNASLGLFAGFAFGVLYITVREHADRSLRQPGDARLWTELTELGAIPSVSMDSKSLYGSRAAARQPKLLAGASGDDLVPDLSEKLELITWQRQPSLMAEAFRSALASILFKSENGSAPQTLVITSTNPREGKSTVVSNLAISAAGIARKVLIIDADMRRPHMHDIFGLPNGRGLSDLLKEGFTEDSIAGLVCTTKVAGVHLITSGSPTYAAADLVYSPNFEALLRTFKKQYDLILVDTPPMLQMPDARVVGRIADAVVLVARAGQTTGEALTAAKERFNEDRIPVLGTILNDWNPKLAPNGYYAHRYSYGPSPSAGSSYGLDPDRSR